jgi:hypothetical protein
MIKLTITGDAAKAAAKRYIDGAELGFVFRLAEPVKKREQEEKYHAMIGDIAAQCTFMGRKFDRESWKRLLIDAYVRVARENAVAEGKPDPFKGQGGVIPNLDGTGFVQLGIQSRGLTVKQASEFIEYLLDYGQNNLVVFADEERWAA